MPVAAATARVSKLSGAFFKQTVSGEMIRMRPCVKSSTTWGEYGLDFRRSICRLFWNHI